MKWVNKGHEFDELGNHFLNYPDFLVYGAGNVGKRLAKFLNKIGMSYSFIDGNPKLQKNGCMGKRVYSPVELKNDAMKKNIVIATSKVYRTQIKSILDNNGFIFEKNYWELEDFLQNILPIYLSYVRNMSYMNYMCYVSTTYCNLNCDGCLNFTPYIKEMKHKDLEEAKHSLDLFFNAVSFVRFFSYTGGEPLLYPHIEELLSYFGQNYREHIDVLAMNTNGTILPSDGLCKILEKYDIHVHIDDYSKYVPSSKETIEKMVEKLNNYHIEYVVNTDDNAYWIDLAHETTNHSNYTEEELIEWHDKCKCPYPCLHENSIYSCNYARFAMNASIIQSEQNDQFCLENYDKTRDKELLEFQLGYTQKGYVEFCKRCAGFLPINPYKKPVGKQLLKVKK